MALSLKETTLRVTMMLQAPYYKDVLSPTLPANGLYFVDHVVGNQPDLTMEDAAKWLVDLR